MLAADTGVLSVISMSEALEPKCATFNDSLLSAYKDVPHRASSRVTLNIFAILVVRDRLIMSSLY